MNNENRIRGLLLAFFEALNDLDVSVLVVVAENQLDGVNYLTGLMSDHNKSCPGWMQTLIAQLKKDSEPKTDLGKWN
jgi:hypothetical protein